MNNSATGGEIEQNLPDPPGRGIAAIAITIVLLGIGAFVTYEVSQRRVSSDFRRAAQVAVDSLVRLHDATDEGALAYTQRLIETENSVDGAKRAARTAPDKASSEALDIWLSVVTSEREWSRLDSEVDNLYLRGGYTKADYQRERDERRDRSVKRQRVIEACENEVRDVLSGGKPTGKCRQMYVGEPKN